MLRLNHIGVQTTPAEYSALHKAQRLKPWTGSWILNVPVVFTSTYRLFLVVLHHANRLGWMLVSESPLRI